MFMLLYLIQSLILFTVLQLVWRTPVGDDQGKRYTLQNILEATATP